MNMGLVVAVVVNVGCAIVHTVYARRYADGIRYMYRMTSDMERMRYEFRDAIVVWPNDSATKQLVASDIFMLPGVGNVRMVNDA